MKPFIKNLSSSQSMAASFNSSSQQLLFVAMASIQAVFTGAPVGSFKLQISNDNSNWTDYSGSDYEISAAGNYVWILAVTPFAYVRVVYTRTSGTGSCTISCYGKGV